MPTLNITEVEIGDALVAGYPASRSFQKQGKLDKAADVYEAILAEEPKHFEATQQLGILRYQQGTRQRRSNI